MTVVINNNYHTARARIKTTENIIQQTIILSYRRCAETSTTY